MTTLCGKNMGNDLLIIPCDLPNGHEGNCERNIWSVNAPRTPLVTDNEAQTHTQETRPATRRCICGLLENDPIHSYEWCFGGIEGAHELTLKPPKSSYPVEQELREMCCRLRACVRKYGLGSGGEQLDELVIAEVDRCHALVDAMENTKSQPISPQSKAPEPQERSEKDFAIENGDYLADAAEAYLNARNRYDIAVAGYADEDSEVPNADELTDCHQALRVRIYEFRKRRDRAALSSPSPTVCFLCQHPVHLVGGCNQCTCLEDSIVKNYKGVCPDCSICGKPSPLGNVCGACEAAKMRGYKMEVDEISGAKSFKDWATHHFCEGFRTGQKVTLKERMDAIGDSPSPEERKPQPSQGTTPACPKCGMSLIEIKYSESSQMLNRDQWESQLAGDLVCFCHNNHRGNKPYAYFWKRELAHPTEPSQGATPATMDVYEFNRYRNGVLMAEGGQVHAHSEEEALKKVRALFSPVPSGEEFKLAKKDFFIDKDPSGKGRYEDGLRYFIDGVLVNRTDFMERRDRECAHRWDADVCVDCHKSKAITR